MEGILRRTATKGKKRKNSRFSGGEGKDLRSVDRVQNFRWLKKFLRGKGRLESLDLLDQWILRKRPLSLFW